MSHSHDGPSFRDLSAKHRRNGSSLSAADSLPRISTSVDTLQSVLQQHREREEGTKASSFSGTAVTTGGADSDTTESKLSTSSSSSASSSLSSSSSSGTPAAASRVSSEQQKSPLMTATPQDKVEFRSLIEQHASGSAMLEQKQVKHIDLPLELAPPILEHTASGRRLVVRCVRDLVPTASCVPVSGVVPTITVVIGGLGSADLCKASHALPFSSHCVDVNLAVDLPPKQTASLPIRLQVLLRSTVCELLGMCCFAWPEDHRSTLEAALYRSPASFFGATEDKRDCVGRVLVEFFAPPRAEGESCESAPKLESILESTAVFPAGHDSNTPDEQQENKKQDDAEMQQSISRLRRAVLHATTTHELIVSEQRSLRTVQRKHSCNSTVSSFSSSSSSSAAAASSSPSRPSHSFGASIMLVVAGHMCGTSFQNGSQLALDISIIDVRSERVVASQVISGEIVVAHDSGSDRLCERHFYDKRGAGGAAADEQQQDGDGLCHPRKFRAASSSLSSSSLFFTLVDESTRDQQAPALDSFVVMFRAKLMAPDSLRPAIDLQQQVPLTHFIASSSAAVHSSSRTHELLVTLCSGTTGGGAVLNLNMMMLCSPHQQQHRQPSPRPPSSQVTNVADPFASNSTMSANRLCAGVVSAFHRTLLRTDVENLVVAPVVCAQSVAVIGRRSNIEESLREGGGAGGGEYQCAVIEANTGLLRGLMQLASTSHVSAALLRVGAAHVHNGTTGATLLLGGCPLAASPDSGKMRVVHHAVQALLGQQRVATSQLRLGALVCEVSAASVKMWRLRQLAALNLLPRAFAAACFVQKSRVLVTGGLRHSDAAHDAVVQLSSRRAQQHSDVSGDDDDDASPRGARYHSALLSDAFFLTFGDETAALSSSSSVEFAVAPPMQRAIAAHSMVFFRRGGGSSNSASTGIIMIFGGLVQDRDERRHAVNDTELRTAEGTTVALASSASPSSSSSTTIADHIPCARFGHSAAVITDTECFSQAVIVGGLTTATARGAAIAVETIASEEQMCWLFSMGSLGDSAAQCWRRISTGSGMSLPTPAEASLFRSAMAAPSSSAASPVAFAPIAVLQMADVDQDDAILTRLRYRSSPFARSHFVAGGLSDGINKERLSEVVVSVGNGTVFSIKFLSLHRLPTTAATTRTTTTTMAKKSRARLDQEYSELPAQFRRRL